MYSSSMQNITLSIIGQRVLLDVLKERKDILKMEVFFFENLDQYFNQLKKNIKKDILVVDFSNFEIIEKSDYKITNPIIYLTENSNKFNYITKFQKYDLISCPLNIMDFINKVNLMFSKFQFADKSKIDFLNYTINLNSREISNNNNKIKLTEREKDFLLFLKKSKKPQTIKNILKSVWGYSDEMETHTVETHVHRLRKKFLNNFNDDNFIKNDKKGYYI